VLAKGLVNSIEYEYMDVVQGGVSAVEVTAKWNSASDGAP